MQEKPVQSYIINTPSEWRDIKNMSDREMEAELSLLHAVRTSIENRIAA